MQLRIFTLRFSPYTESFDDSAVVGFLADKDVLSLNEYFFTQDGVPYLSVVVHYRTVTPPASAPAATSEQKRDEAWRELLTAADWSLFNTTTAAREKAISPPGTRLGKSVLSRPCPHERLGASGGQHAGRTDSSSRRLVALAKAVGS